MPIEFKSLSYVYSKDMPYEYKALNDINLRITEGKITAIVGKTGSGKSTLVQHLNALLLPSDGRLEILDYKIIANEKTSNLKNLRQRVGLVFQFSEYQLFEETIIKDVAFGPKNFGASEEEAIEKAREALKLVGISKDYYMRSPLDLSGGQKRRVAIAGILAMNPDVIVLDEPTAGLDPKGAKEMVTLFNKLNKELNKTIILVTHDNEVVFDYADEVVVLENGRIKYHDSVKEFFNNTDLIEDMHIVKPNIIDLRDKLRDRGYKLSDNVDTIDQLIKELCHE